MFDILRFNAPFVTPPPAKGTMQHHAVLINGLFNPDQLQFRPEAHLLSFQNGKVIHQSSFIALLGGFLGGPGFGEKNDDPLPALQLLLPRQ